MIHGRSFWLSAGITSAVIILDVIMKLVLYLHNFDHISLFYLWLGSEQRFQAGVYLFLALPLLTSLAYSWTVSFDRKSGYLNHIITRTSRRKYYIAKFLVSFVSGGLIFVGALVLHFMLLALFNPVYVPHPDDCMGMCSSGFASKLFYQNPYLFAIVWLFAAFGWGGAMASISTAAGMFIRKYTVASMAAFVVFTVQQMIGVFIMRNYTITLNENPVSLVWSGMLWADCGTLFPGQIQVTILLITFVSAAVYAFRCRKYDSM